MREGRFLPVNRFLNIFFFSLICEFSKIKRAKYLKKRHVADEKMGGHMRRLWKYGLILLLGLIVIGAGFIIYLKKEADISHMQDRLQQPTGIYDQDGNLSSTVTANKSEGVPIEEVPQHVLDAIVSIEDHRFYEHHGIDYQAILRAVVKNVKAGSVVEGGSTLTQQ